MFKRIVSMVLVICLLLMAGCQSNEKAKENVAQENAAQESETRTVVDMAGREVVIPNKIEKVFSTNPSGTLLLYSLDPDKLIGWNYDLRPDEKRFIEPKYHNLPNLGSMSSKLTGSEEEILKINPDIFICMGEINDTSISEADKIQSQLKIPVLMLDYELTGLDKTYEFLGNVLKEEDKAKKLADYCKNTISSIQEKAKEIPAEKQVTIYYAEGPKGLETDPKGTWHTQVIDIINAFNVAEVSEKQEKGRAAVSLEQLLLWDPDMIISWSDDRGGYYSGILDNADWANLKAIKSHNVYSIPDSPFTWFDRPPSANRILGVIWLADLCYPDIYNYDIQKEVKEFYELFYHHTLTEQELDELLANATNQPS